MHGILRDTRVICKRRTVLAGGLGALTLGVSGLRAEVRPRLLRVTAWARPAVALDRDGLEGLPQVAFETETIWTEGLITFSGPRLRDVLALAGITEGRILLKALNDYEVEMDLEEMGEDWPIIATRQNGQPFGVRDQGPLWLVYPYDDEDLGLSRERIHTLSVWQLVQVQELPR